MSKKILPGKITKIIQKAGMNRFLLIGEREGKAVIMCWNGKEYQNQVDLMGLLGLGFRACVNSEASISESITPQPTADGKK